MAASGLSKTAQARFDTLATLPVDVPRILQDAIDHHFNQIGCRDTFPIATQVKIDKDIVGAHIMVMSKWIPALSSADGHPYSQAQIDDLDNCAKALESIFVRISEDTVEHKGSALRKTVCLRVPRYFYENGIPDSTSLFDSPYEPKHDLRILIDYALYICSEVADGNHISIYQKPKPPPPPKRPSLTRRLTSYGKSIADRLAK